MHKSAAMDVTEISTWDNTVKPVSWIVYILFPNQKCNNKDHCIAYLYCTIQVDSRIEKSINFPKNFIGDAMVDYA